ncbi:MAG: HAD family hydrolase [Chloroflexaceae bacterium]
MSHNWTQGSPTVAEGVRVTTLTPPPATATVRFAFFDVDETLIRIKSMFSFKEFFQRHYADGTEAARIEQYQQFIRRIEDYQRRGMRREFINRAYYESYQGQEPERIRTCARAWFSQIRAEISDLYVTQTRGRLHAHQARGEEPVLVSGSSVEILAPVAEELGVQHVLATRLEVKNGRYTGRILLPQMIGDGKRIAVMNFMETHGASPQECFAYGDHPSDLPLLEAVGNPRIVGEDARMLAVAVERGWEVVQTRSEEKQVVK